MTIRIELTINKKLGFQVEARCLLHIKLLILAKYILKVNASNQTHYEHYYYYFCVQQT